MQNKPLKQQQASTSSPVKRMAEVRQILFNSEKKPVSSKFDAVSNDSLNKSHWKIQGLNQFHNNDVQSGFYSTVIGGPLNPGEKVKNANHASQIKSDNQRLQSTKFQHNIEIKNKESVPKTPINQSNVVWDSINAEGNETKRLRPQADVNRRQIYTTNQTDLKIHQQKTDMPGLASSPMKASRPDYGKSDMSVIFSNKDKRDVFNIIQKRFNMSQFSKQTDATQSITQKRLDFSKFKLPNNTLAMPDIQSMSHYGGRQTANTEKKKNRFNQKFSHPDYENYDKPLHSENTLKSKSVPKAVTKLRDAVKESNLFENDQFFDSVVDQTRKQEKAGGNMIKPGDISLLDKTSYPKTTEEILQQFRQQRQNKKKKHNKQSLMVGRTDYKLPDADRLKVIQNDQALVLEKSFAKGLANNDTHQEGFIYMVHKEEREKRKKDKEVNPIKQYIQNFQETEDMLHGSKDGKGKGMLSSIAKKFDEKIKSGIVMQNLQGALFAAAKKNQQQRVSKHMEGVVDVLKLEEQKGEAVMNVFNVVQRDEANAIRNIGNDLLKRMEYQQMFKQTEISDRKQFGFDLEYDSISKSNISNIDPKVQYFMKCKQQLEVALPILDKVYRKTLCLQDYQLSQGHCKGIAVACQYFDDKLVNRVLFQNNGMDGDQFADILKGLSKLSDVKSIIYVQNGINSKALDAMVPLLERKLPHHLQELRLIDIKSSASLMNDIITKISMCSQISKLALVNCQQSDKTFEIITNYVKESKFLKELDLSWCAVRQGTIFKLLQVIKQNKQLTHLNLSWNSLLEKQSLTLTPEDIAAGKTNPELSPINLEIMSCFKEFIKYNPNLIELNLSNTKLTNAAILYLCYCLQRATSLRTIHLCGNMSRPRFKEQFAVEEDEEESDPFFAIIRQVANRIKAKDGFKYMNIKTHDHHTEIEASPDFKQIQRMKKLQSVSPSKKEANSAPNVNAIERHKQLLAMLSKGLNNQVDDKSNEVDSLAWRHLRAGLRVRNILHATRMHDIKLSATNVEQKKLVITRQLGFQKLCQGSAQWEILTKANSECWVCGQWNFTLFIWTTRFGQIATTKDAQKIKYYTDAIKKNECDEVMPRIFEIPHIGGAFNDWRWQKMLNMIDFCMENDQNAPDFLKMMIDKKEVRAVCGEPSYETLNEHEISRIEKTRREYYQENWPKMILKHIPLKKPNIANVQSLTSISEQFDVTEEVFFHCAFVKPGRHDYVVRFTHMEFNRDEEVDEKGITMNTITGKLNLNLSGRFQRQIERKKSLRNREIYIHEFIASFRQEELPQYHKERKMEQKIIQKFEAKDVFRDFKEDTYETVSACIAADLKNIRYNEICNFDERDMKMTDDKVKTNYKLIKQVFQFLQAKSKRFPLVDHKTLFEHFVKPAEVTKHSALAIQDIEIIYLESKFDPRDEAHSSQNGMARWQFCEFLCRLAKYLFLGNRIEEVEQTFRRNHSKLYEGKEYDKSNITDIRVHNAVHMMCTTVISRWADNVTAPTHENFRKYDLWVHTVELLFTMNEAALKQVYNFLCQNKQGEDDKPLNMDVLAMSDCRWFFINELKLPLKKADIQLCFAESKMTIINEQEKDSTNKYKKLVYVEFLEFIARIALKLFKDSELEELQLNEKIETVLDYMFDYLHLEKEKQEIHIEEFSASDDDY